MTGPTNIIAVNETTGITGGSWIVPTYDANGNMKHGPKPGDETTERRCIYDAWNRMVQVTDGSDTVSVTYRYNGLNFRVRKLLGPDGDTAKGRRGESARAEVSAVGDGKMVFYNENWQVLEERKGGSTNPYAQYVWDARTIDAPVVRFRDVDGGNTREGCSWQAPRQGDEGFAAVLVVGELAPAC